MRKHLQILSLFIVLLLSATNSSAKTILIIGDSLSAGYGINLEDGWVNLLQKKLDKKEAEEKTKQYRVINASISGNTSGMGLSRTPDLLKEYKPDIVIIELGGNDGLQGHPLKVMRKNLSSMITLSQAANAKVLLASIQIPPNYGKRYTEEFFSSFQTIADQHNVLLVPFIIESIATNTKLMQNDGVHPTAKAQPLLLDNVWVYLKDFL